MVLVLVLVLPLLVLVFILRAKVSDVISVCFMLTDVSVESCDVFNPRYLVEFAAENKLQQVQAVLVKHPDQVSHLSILLLLYHTDMHIFSTVGFHSLLKIVNMSSQ